jgi:hypothetical protein
MGVPMRTVAEYREYAEGCRGLAEKTTDPNNKHALELMAKAWDKVANEREAALKKTVPPQPERA